MHAFWEYIRKVDSDGKFKIMMNDCFSENNGNWKFVRSLEQVNIYIYLMKEVINVTGIYFVRTCLKVLT